MWHRQIKKTTPKVVTGSVLLPLGGLLCAVLIKGLSSASELRPRQREVRA